MNRRKFFAIAPAAVLAPVAAHSAGTVEDGVFVPSCAPVMAAKDFSKALTAARKKHGRAVKTHRHFESFTTPEGWEARYGIIDIISVDGRAVALRRSPYGNGINGELYAAVRAGRITANQAKTLAL